eukprot:TRINITY_DN41429_c1_g1_i2.p1 TRINITY_DN41429_c1_g1~~TRINITY_DN41429_c1_g1_i2.p1  ORF type:complete len:131 (-),score=12.95 TRINITY_DN41429_c1_g1_i2:436-828(-)
MATDTDQALDLPWVQIQGIEILAYILGTRIYDARPNQVKGAASLQLQTKGLIWLSAESSIGSQKSKKRKKSKHQYSTNLCIFGGYTQIIQTPHIKEAERQDFQAVKCRTVVVFFYLYCFQRRKKPVKQLN